MEKIIPCLWFDMNCEEAVNYYVDTFNDSPNKKQESKIISIQRYEEGMETPGIENMVGKVLTIIFELNGLRFMALDGGPIFKFNESVSFVVDCEDQEELDHFWEKFSAVPESEQCGWCKDKFGLSWQITPKALGVYLSDEDQEKSHRVLNAMLEMKKLDVEGLERAYRGE